MMGYMNKLDAVAEKYLLAVFDLEPGEGMLIPFESESERVSMRNKLYMTMNAMKPVQPLARAVLVKETTEMGKPFIYLQRLNSMPAVATIVKKDGTLVDFRVNQSERYRRIRQMIEDGMDRDDICNSMKSLSKEEKDFVEKIEIELRKGVDNHQ